MWQNTDTYENYHKNWTSHRKEVLGPEVAEHRKVRELPRKIDITQRRSSWAGCGRTPKSTRITTKNRHHTEKKFLGRMWQNTEKYDNYHEKWTSKKLKSRKLRKFTYKTRTRRSQPSRKYENYHKKCTCKQETTKIAADSVRHLRSSTPACYYYRKNPKC